MSDGFWKRIQRALFPGPKVTRDDWDAFKRSQRYAAEHRDHFEVVLYQTIKHNPDHWEYRAELVDCSTIERDVELRSISLCRLPDSRVMVRELKAVRDGLGRPTGEWKTWTYHVKPLVGPGPSIPPNEGVMWPWSNFF